MYITLVVGNLDKWSKHSTLFLVMNRRIILCSGRDEMCVYVCVCVCVRERVETQGIRHREYAS